MRTIVAITAALAIVAGVIYLTHPKKADGISDDCKAAWTSWKQTYGKAYGTNSEEAYRAQVFEGNFNFVKSFSDDKMTVGLNVFADLTNDEFKKQFTGFRQNNQLKSQDNVKILDTTDLPDSVDWRTNKAVTDVKNQGSCGSCWAFSTTGSMEGRNFLKNGTLVSLSEQQFVDCAGAQGNQGCSGGLMDQAFTYAKDNGINTEAEYPYKGRDGTCTAKATGVKVPNFADVKTNSPTQLKAAVAEGPVSIALDGAGLPFQFYFGGIIRHLCGTSLDHGVLIVGYGSEASTLFGQTDFWIVKNSWGASWGEKGYLRIENNNKDGDAGVCGLNQQPSYPIF